MKKTKAAIFWATLAIVNSINGINVEGAARFWVAAALGFSLIMLWAQTRGKDENP